MADSIIYSDDSYAKQIYAKQVRTVYGSFTIAIAGTFIGAFLLIMIQWDVANKTNMLLWFALFSIFHVIRATFIYRFNKLQPDDESCFNWGRGFVYSSIAAGCIWGLGVYITFIPNNLTSELSVAIITVGLSAGAVSTLSILRSAFIAYVIPIMFSLVILFLLEMTYITNIISFILFSTMVFIMRGANTFYISNMDNFRLLLEATEREELLIAANVSAEIANKTQSEFLDNMSHELRTPLHGILGFAQVGLDKAKDSSDESYYKYFSRISESGERLKILLDDLLDLRKLEEGEFELNIELNNIEKIITNCVGEQEAVINSRHLKVSFNFYENVPKVKCDKNRIGQVIMNLLSNAIKFSPADSEINFTMKLHNDDTFKDSVIISVSDQGPGIDEDELESIFDKFMQAKKSVSNSGGTGLGLAITREIIKEHGGRIWCENNTKAGVSFNIILPL